MLVSMGNENSLSMWVEYKTSLSDAIMKEEHVET